MSSELDSQALLSMVLESVQDPVTVVDACGATRMQNRASRQTLPNPPPASLAEWDAGFVLHTPDGARRLLIEEWPMSRALAGESVIDEELAVLLPTDPLDTHTLLATARPLRDANGAVKGAILVSRDVTDRKRLERTLAQAERMQALGRLSSGVAHDFNNILTAIGACAESLQHHQDAQHRREIAERILVACDHGADLVGQLLRFARRQPLRLRPLAVDAEIRQLSALLRTALPASIDLDLNLEGGSAEALADASLLSNALLNLAANARDAMPEGGRLRITTRLAGDWFVIEVCDTGHGIPIDLQQHVFEPFFTTKDEDHGSGLGLAMVYSFITGAGGEVTLRSAPGAGAEFSLRLPLYAPSESRA